MSQKPLPDHATRLDLTKKLLASARIPKAPPVGFDPLKASSDELKSYGLPPKPDATTNPERYAKWSKYLAKPLKFVAPTFEIIENDRNPLAKNQAKFGSGTTSGNWSGYMVTDPSPATKYSAVEGEWTVPNVYPANTTVPDGTYNAANWVGIDGWSNTEVLQTGTDSVVTLSGGGISHSVFPWYEWFPAFYVQISNFAVNPGDTIWGYIDAESATEGYAFLYNVGAGTYTSATFSSPSGTSLQGSSAEWILENNSFSAEDFPNFGSSVFFDTWAYSGQWQNLSNGGISITLNDGVPLTEQTDETSTSFISLYV